MGLSVFTATHRPRYLDDCYASLRAQTLDDFEWVVCLNQGASWSPERDDSRIRIVADDSIVGVGAAKRRACEEVSGNILVELDHDDLLASDALSQIERAFDENPEASLVYSHCAQVLEDGSRDGSTFNPAHGWRYREATVDGRKVQYPVALEPTPHNVSLIWYSPNHVRAFRRGAYDDVGGHDPAREILDDQDLMCRLYEAGDFHLIDRCLYLQRMWPGNTQSETETNARIQRETVALYDRHIEANALAWARRQDLYALDLGAAHNRPAGYLGVDKRPGDGVDIVAELPARLLLDDSSVGVIRAVDFLEHVADKVALINELYRVLAPGGMLLSQTPSSDGRGAWQDPSHVAAYNENSFWYYTEPRYRAYVPEITARFQVSRLVTYFPTDWHEQHQISYVAANLIALKGPEPRNGGPVHWG
jgi:SAM-dependent methyltransferase